MEQSLLISTPYPPFLAHHLYKYKYGTDLYGKLFEQVVKKEEVELYISICFSVDFSEYMFRNTSIKDSPLAGLRNYDPNK